MQMAKKSWESRNVSAIEQRPSMPTTTIRSRGFICIFSMWLELDTFRRFSHCNEKVSPSLFAYIHIRFKFDFQLLPHRRFTFPITFSWKFVCCWILGSLIEVHGVFGVKEMVNWIYINGKRLRNNSLSLFVFKHLTFMFMGLLYW